MEHVKVYDKDGHMLAVLDNALDVGYELKHNDLWTGSFTLPAADPKNAFCQARCLVRLPDGDRDTGLYRIIGMPSAEETADGGRKTYQLEHVMATLFDDILFGYHEVGGADVDTADVIEYILARQTVTRWVLGECDFTDYFQYSFENVSLLNALLSLGEVLTEEYTWVFDTDTTPWTVSLKRADSSAGCGIHYGRSLVGVEKTMDASGLVTRLYPLGAGEGVNQTTIAPVNQGVPYIDADTAATWGVISAVWTDTRIDDPGLLLARARQILAAAKQPYITYTASAIDLYRITGQSWDDYMPGKLVRVMDDEHGISFSARIVSVSKQDVRGDPGDVTVTIANAPRDEADQINTLADRVSIGELYSQGATNLFAQSFADNADAEHPASFKFYLPQGLRRVNSLLLSWQLTPFRAYETGAAGGGGGRTTSDGGGAVVATTGDGGGLVITTEQTHYSSSGIGLTGSAGGHDHTVNSHAHGLGSHKHAAKWGHTHDLSTSTTETSGVHAYATISPETGAATGNTGSASPGTDTQGAHTHDIVEITIPPLDVRIPNHDHSVSIPEHNHTVTMPVHEHDLVFGIYEGTTATGVTIIVDDTPVPAAAITGGELDVSQWMEADEEGRILRGVWHEIQIVPDQLTRIEANLYAQVFIQSTGGGDY